MKSQFKNTPIALALAALFITPMAFAGSNDDGQDGGRHHDPVNIHKDISLDQDIAIKGLLLVGGIAKVDASSVAIVNDAQINHDNSVQNGSPADLSNPEKPIQANGGSTNTSTITNNALSSASGNIGLNVGTGDNNQQANAAAFSAADASFVFGSSDAEVFALQSVKSNTTNNYGHTNTATLNGNALNSASGNIGVNIAAGTSNQQKNDLAASVAVARIATATVGLTQSNSGNSTTNQPVAREEVQNHAVNLALNAAGGYLGLGAGGYSGSTGGQYSGSQSGSTSGNSYQSSNFYPDTWSSTQLHPCTACVQTGHIDIDSQAQGAVQNPAKPGVGGLGFDNTGSYSGSQSGSYSGSERGTLGFIEAGGISLAGAVTGNIPVTVAVNLNTTNTSLLGDNALQSASGNIGVNIASGTNNQQFNGLAISATQAHTGGGSSVGSHPGEL